jgi:hypothetical protein
MAVTNLSWDKITWENFEEISLHLISNKFNLNTIDKYYSKGYKQFGIDLLGKKFDFENGIEISVQCKKVEKFKKTDLKNVVEEFLNHEFSTTSKFFIITVKTDTVKLTNEIRKYQNNEFKEKKIHFECWGVTELETRLKENYRIVFNYFGERQANEYCFLQGINKLRIKHLPIKDFIQRQVIKIEKDEEGDLASKIFELTKRIDLTEIFKQEKLISQHICLIADAYNGKSFFLEQLANDLQNIPNKLCPLLIKIGQFSLKPIKEILDSTYGTWKEIPGKEIVVIIDGLDEVHSNEFIKACELISEFVLEYNLVHTIFSCRTLFFNEYKVHKIIKQFELYELADLDTVAIEKYLKTQLTKNQKEFFIKYINGNELNALVKEPFTLVNLVEQFKKGAGKLPLTKYEVIENYISEAIEKSFDRKSETGRYLKENRRDFTIAIKKFALAMQLLSSNSISDADFQILFANQKERDLLRHCPFIRTANEKHFFVNALFQEHLAAAYLCKLSFSSIEEICFIGNYYKKIKLKWIQTISSMLSAIYNKDIALYHHIITLIENDNIELLALTENNIFKPDFIKEIFIKIIDKYVLHDIRPLTRVVQEGIIASFVNKLPDAIDILLNYTEKNNSSIVKSTCWRIMYYLNATISQKKQINNIVNKELKSSMDPYYCKLLLEVIQAFKLHNEIFIAQLISSHPLNSKHEFRDGIYEMINDLNLNDKFYEYGLCGITPLLEHNKAVSHYNSEYDVLEMMFGTNSPINFIKFLQVLQSNEWWDFLDRQSIIRKEITTRICETATKFLEHDSTVLVELLEYSRFICSKHDEGNAKIILEFFIQQKIAWIATRYLYIYRPIECGWYGSKLFSQEQIDFFLFEYEEGILTDKEIRSIVGFSYSQQNSTFHDTFKALANAATNNQLFPEHEERYWKKYREREAVKQENNIKHLLSRSIFLRALKEFFKGYGKKGLRDEEIWIDADERENLRNANSYVIQRFLNREMRSNGIVYLKDCLKKFETDKQFNFFRAATIIEDNILDTDDSRKLLLPKLEHYYSIEINTANFRTAITETGAGLTYRIKEKLLSDIFARYAFNTSPSILVDMIWCDREGITSIPKKNADKKNGLSLQIIKALQNTGHLELLKETVVDNLQNGIKGKIALGTHLAIANYLNLKEITGLLSDLLFTLNLNDYFFKYVLDFYINLDGDISKLNSLIIATNDFNSIYYFTLIEEMEQSQPSITIGSLQKCLAAMKSNNETKMTAAKHLASLGRIEGFSYIMNAVKQTGKAPYQIQSRFAIWNIDTRFALEEIEQIMYMVVDEKYKSEKFYESAQNFIIEVLYGLSSKSENDLMLVEEHLKIWSNQLANAYSNHKLLLWHSTNIVENFRNSYSKQKTNKEVAAILSMVAH